MVIKLKYLIPVFFFIIECFPQSEDISQKKSELSSIKTEINNLEKELASKSTAEKKSFEAVENLNKQNFLINKVLGQLRTEINKKENEIKIVEGKIKQTESEIKILQDNYATYVKAIYKKGQYNELESLFDAASLQQAVMRTYYLQVFAKQREKDLTKLKDKKGELDESKALLKKERNEKLLLAKARDDEKQVLTQKLNERKTALNSIKKNNKELKKVIVAKKEAQKKTEQLIAQLIERDASANKEQLVSTDKSAGEKNKIRDENVGYDYDLNTASFASFAELKGKMIWPLHKGKVIRKFGENKHKSLNTVTLNYGVDIKADKDKNVRSVGEGVVAAIDWLPGYGNVIIISHKNNYRTVYSHVSEIFVSEGEKVKSGSVLALVDESIDGYVLHFEIWKGRDKQNPELWLAKK
ncbi:MAG TPA: peptidoglycan DD-metalloendopeptidase family protein [Ignavibacteriaceae bacterium]|nr:peptidoglycan DD-metalloendopeptidase family protein [Ignavibacteriaceae bacterium]